MDTRHSAESVPASDTLSPLMQAIEHRSAGARATGDLKPASVRHVVLEEEGLRFVLRIPEQPAPPPGGPRDPNFNPFLPPDKALTVGPVGDEHVMVLNKFPVCHAHVVLARTAFFEQQTPLEHSDFAAMARLLGETGGLGFYNGGPDAGASQRHKHVQWLPAGEHNPSLQSFVSVFNPQLDDQAVVIHPALGFRHCFVRVLAGKGMASQDSAASLHQAFGRARDKLSLAPDAQGLLPAFNLLVEDGWMMVVPRRREHFETISLNALSYGGLLQLTHADEETLVRRHGPLAVLAGTAFAASEQAE
ncbi:MAG: phosphorylase [Castellaniella sp.]